MNIVVAIVIALCFYLQCVESSASKNDEFRSECKLPDNSNGTCIDIKYCPAAITAKKVYECYTDEETQYVCCKRNLWNDLKEGKLVAASDIPDYNIIGGFQTKFKEFPYMAALGWESTFSTDPYDFKCGGTLVAYNYVLTAAHCANLNGLPPSVVVLGGTNLTDSSNIPLKVFEVITHPEYRQNESYHDIALLRVDYEAAKSSIRLWSIYPLDDTNLTAIGYGHTQFGGPSSEHLLKTYLSVVPNNECSSQFDDEDSLPQGIAETQLCAKDSERNSDTCQGDSGGPLILRSTSPYGIETPFIVGITSFGHGCSLNVPGVYTRVSEYFDWVEEVVYNTTNKLIGLS